ncbi:hypothetical protein C492_07015 [Natronococcus jeotgali DSM 18795]|uniref:Uncharacterized protein n=1 Tax=Natronococcus jeotgali DSM 18795 TaxID=1227498 RepID=L9XSE2_9EURY|nr:hypothetical protein [Natronococcus jeotgali]ELY63528.1 hypothetical protein C492_07015 [Natronococcus jeotgali DSM 18795]
MSVIPTEWGKPDSRPGIYYELLWIGLAVVVLGTLAYWEPFSITISITPQRLASATTLGVILGIAVTYSSFVSERFQRLWADFRLGVILGIAVTYSSFVSERFQRLWADFRIRFAGLFVLSIGVQLGLAVAPTWTVLTMLATFLILIPLRVAVYLRTR